MDKAELRAEEARAWHKDLAVARRRLTPSLAVAGKYLKSEALVLPVVKPETSATRLKPPKATMGRMQKEEG
jgi:hypothetical protein